MPYHRLEEHQRVTRLHQLGILDTPQDRLFRCLTEQALARFPGTSIAAISLVDKHRQWFKAVIGLDATQTPRSVSFCSHTVDSSGIMVIPDARQDSRFARNPLVTSPPGIRFYAGVGLMDGVGALCVIGLQPRQVTGAEIATLVKLAQYVDLQLSAHSAAQAYCR